VARRRHGRAGRVDPAQPLRAAVDNGSVFTFDAMTPILLACALELRAGAPIARLIAWLDTWPSSYVPAAKA
jgi:hypothetical protein